MNRPSSRNKATMTGDTFQNRLKGTTFSFTRMKSRDEIGVEEDDDHRRPPARARHIDIGPDQHDGPQREAEEQRHPPATVTAAAQG
jgi:hypothetical protein